MATIYGFTPLGYDQVTGLGSAKLLPTPPPGAIMVLVACSGAAVRWRDDSIAPTAAIGMPLAAGQEFQYAGDLAGIQFIQQASSATLDISFYR
jgi:hypothetical protein